MYVDLSSRLEDAARQVGGNAIIGVHDTVFKNQLGPMVDLIEIILTGTAVTIKEADDNIG